VSDLTPATYYWQVRATTATGTASADNGSWWSFTIAEDGLTNLAPGTYYWQAKATTASGSGEADNGLWWSVTIAPGGFMKYGPAHGISGLGTNVTVSCAARDGS